MSRVVDWLDNRTGCRQVFRAVFFHEVPPGGCWRRALAHAVWFSLLTQMATGLALWCCYAAGAQTAWASVFYLQSHVAGGWFLRGLHHFNAQALTVLLALRLAQMIVDGTYRAPREANFWVLLALFPVVIAASVTGWLLPWDQKGYWETKVATNILSITPLVGPALQRIVVGGSNYGQQTLMRFFALHAGVIPFTLLGLMAAHAWLFRRHGYAAAPPPGRKSGRPYWPDQALRDAIAAAAVLGFLTVLTISRHGTELAPPADPTESFSAARPQWFLLPLYQFLKLFPGGMEVFGAVVIPGLFFALAAAMPFIARRARGQIFNVAVVAVVAVAAVALLWRAKAADKADPVYQASQRQLEIDAARIKVLANGPQGIPAAGALTLLQRDPATQGPRLFARYCASCHRWGGNNGMGLAVSDSETASDLQGYGSRQWLTGLLDPAQVDGPHYFGGTAHKAGKMVKFVKTKVSKFSPAQKEDLRKIIAAVSAEAHLPAQRSIDATEAVDIQAGTNLFRGEINCADCHQFHVADENATAPDLTGFASREWLESFIGNPGQERFYGEENDRMPAFLDKRILDTNQIALLAAWIRGDY